MVEFLNFAQDLDRRHGVRSFLEMPKERNFRWADLVQRNLNEEKVLTTSKVFYHVSNSGCCSLMAGYCHITILLPSDAALCSHEGQERTSPDGSVPHLRLSREKSVSLALACRAQIRMRPTLRLRKSKWSATPNHATPTNGTMHPCG
jgi:hypothetical protein